MSCVKFFKDTHVSLDKLCICFVQEQRMENNDLNYIICWTAILAIVDLAWKPSRDGAIYG